MKPLISALLLVLVGWSAAVTTPAQTMADKQAVAGLSSGLDLLILGKGFVGSFVDDCAREAGLAVRATTRDGRNGTLRFAFDPAASPPALAAAFAALPCARTLLVTFPLASPAAAAAFAAALTAAHAPPPRLILLGTTGMWGAGRRLTRRAPRDPALSAGRQAAEAALLAAYPAASVWALAGLVGGARQVPAWLPRVFPNPAAVAAKTSLHLVHGADIARAVVAAVQTGALAGNGDIWLLTDGRVYDWWEIAEALSPSADVRAWVKTAMEEQGVTALPRSLEALQRSLDSTEFWETLGIDPQHTLGDLGIHLPPESSKGKPRHGNL